MAVRVHQFDYLGSSDVTSNAFRWKGSPLDVFVYAILQKTSQYFMPHPLFLVTSCLGHRSVRR